MQLGFTEVFASAAKHSQDSYKDSDEDAALSKFTSVLFIAQDASPSKSPPFFTSTQHDDILKSALPMFTRMRYIAHTQAMVKLVERVGGLNNFKTLPSLQETLALGDFQLILRKNLMVVDVVVLVLIPRSSQQDAYEYVDNVYEIIMKCLRPLDVLYVVPSFIDLLPELR